MGTVTCWGWGAGATLLADYPFVAGDAGVKTFTNGVTLTQAGSRTVTGTDTVTNTITGSQTVTVDPSSATHLSLTGLSEQAAGTQQSLTVTARDAYENVARGEEGTAELQ